MGTLFGTVKKSIRINSKILESSWRNTKPSTKLNHLQERCLDQNQVLTKKMPNQSKPSRRKMLESLQAKRKRSKRRIKQQNKPRKMNDSSERATQIMEKLNLNTAFNNDIISIISQ